MRVTSMVPDMQYGIQQSEQSLQTALQQLTTGKRVNQLSDDPGASASMVRSLAASANVDQYTKNVSTVLSQMQSADSALSTVVTTMNQAVTLGIKGASGTVSAANRQAIATQVQAVLTDVMAQANSSFQGAYLFGGSATGTAPFTGSSTTGYTYVGNSTVNSVPVGDSTSAQVNLPGNQIFSMPPVSSTDSTPGPTSVIGSLTALATALQTGTTAQISAASTAVSTALNYVGQQRVGFDNTVSQLNSQESYLGQESLTLSTQQTSLVGVDTAQAATTLSQAELTNSAVLEAAAKVLPETLLDYLK